MPNSKPVPTELRHLQCHKQKVLKDQELALETENADRLAAGMYPLSSRRWQTGNYTRGLDKLNEQYGSNHG